MGETVDHFHINAIAPRKNAPKWLRNTLFNAFNSTVVADPSGPILSPEPTKRCRCHGDYPVLDEIVVQDWRLSQAANSIFRLSVPRDQRPSQTAKAEIGRTRTARW